MPFLAKGFRKRKLFFAKVIPRISWSIRVRPEHPISFKPGQMLGIEEEGKVVERSYSICSSPHEPKWSFSSSSVP